MRFMVRTIQQDFSDDPWSGWAWVRIEDATLRRILENRELFQMVKSKNDQLCEMTFWGHSAYFFEDGDINYEDFLTRVEIEEFEAMGVLRVPDARALPGNQGSDFDQESEDASCEQLVITDQGVSFYGIIARVDCGVRSDELGWALLLR